MDEELVSYKSLLDNDEDLLPHKSLTNDEQSHKSFLTNDQIKENLEAVKRQLATELQSMIDQLQDHKYHRFGIPITREIFYDHVCPIIFSIGQEQKLLLKTYISRVRYAHDRFYLYIKNADTKAYRHRLEKYFIYLTQGKRGGKKPPMYLENRHRAEQLGRNILVLYKEYGFTFAIWKYTERIHDEVDTYYTVALK